MGTGSIPGVKCGQGVLLTTHPLLVPWSWKSRANTSTHPLDHTGPVTGSLYLYCPYLTASYFCSSNYNGIVSVGYGFPAFIKSLTVNRLTASFKFSQTTWILFFFFTDNLHQPHFGCFWTIYIFPATRRIKRVLEKGKEVSRAAI